ncbi:MAG: DUF3341 domain-containing protein [Nitrososphaerales archaeon]
MTVRPEDLGMPDDGVIRRRHHEPIPFAEPAGLYGVMAEFTAEDDLMSAVRAARAAGYTRLDAFTPYPVEGLSELVAPPINLGKARDRAELTAAIRRRDLRGVADWLGRFNLVALLTLGGGIVGGIVGYALQLWSMARWYPYLNIGGRPYNSWPYYLPITYELTILFASLTAIISMIVLNGLPQPYHPVFNVPEFARATQDRFFLLIHADDPNFSAGDRATRVGTRQFLESLAPGRVYDAEK